MAALGHDVGAADVAALESMTMQQYWANVDRLVDATRTAPTCELPPAHGQTAALTAASASDSEARTLVLHTAPDLLRAVSHSSSVASCSSAPANVKRPVGRPRAAAAVAATAAGPTFPIFTDRVILLGSGISPTQRATFAAKITQFQGVVATALTGAVTDLVVPACMSLQQVLSFYKVDALPPQVKTHSCEWLVWCLQFKAMAPEGVGTWPITVSYHSHTATDAEVGRHAKRRRQGPRGDSSEEDDEIVVPVGPIPPPTATSETTKLAEKLAEASNLPSSTSWKVPVLASKKMINKRHTFACQQSGQAEMLNLNPHLTDPLEELEEMYEALGPEHEYRASAYKKAVGVLKQLSYKVTSAAQLANLPSIGGSMHEVCSDVLRMGYARRLDSLKKNPQVKAVLELSGIWGVGFATANKLYKQGFQTVEQLWRAVRVQPDLLTASATIGLHNYWDLLCRIPRIEVQAIETLVLSVANTVWPGIVGEACGSYRRGKTSSGDVDILLTHPDGVRRPLGPVLDKLFEVGFLTEELTSSVPKGSKRAAGHMEIAPEDRSKSFMGLCRTPQPAKWVADILTAAATSRTSWLRGCPPEVQFNILAMVGVSRRIDIKSYARQQYPYALLYFTGSDHFNRSMRFFAKKAGLSLSDTGLCVATRVGGDRIHTGNSVYVENERGIFEALGLDYKEPWERNVYDQSMAIDMVQDVGGGPATAVPAADATDGVDVQQDEEA